MKTRMKPLLLASALVVAGVGCSKKSSDSGGDPCATAINSAVDKMMAARGKDAPPAMKDISEKLRTLMTQHCRDDKWPSDVVTCFTNASDQPSMKKCRQQLSPELAQKLQTDIIKVMSAGARENVREHGGMGMGHSGMSGAMGGEGAPDMGGGSGGSAGGGAPAGSAAPSATGSAAPAGSAH
jgi:hypothetical protein